MKPRPRRAAELFTSKRFAKRVVRDKTKYVRKQRSQKHAA
jgi:hypothetical protein